MKNLVKNNQQPKAMEMGVKDLEAQAASKNMKPGAAYEAPLMVNRERDQPHLGNLPRAGSGKF